MKVLILGGGGMLGHKISQRFANDFETSATFRDNLIKYKDLPVFKDVRLIPGIDANNIVSIYKCIEKVKPEIIINAIGIIKQLPDSKNNVKTIAINSLLPHQLASFTIENNIRLINISTDCVFSGQKGNYTENDFPDAVDLYGKSKNLGEVIDKNCLTIRTSIIGRELFSSHSLLEWFLSNRGKKVKGFVNAIYTGFPTMVLTDVLKRIILEFSELNGLFHISSNKINKFELLELINKEFKSFVEIEPFEDFYIDRSLDSTNFRKITGYQPPEWEEMVKMMFEDSKLYEFWRK